MDPNSRKSLEVFVKTFEKVACIIKEIKPDCIVAPMFGAVPFIDILNIVDDEFPNEKVIYVPASNKVHRLRDVLRGTFENIINAMTPDGGNYLSIDEVVSGNSLVRVYKQFDAARTNYANKKAVQIYGEKADFRNDAVVAYRDSVRDAIKYNSIGIVDSKMDRMKKKKSPDYEKFVADGLVLPVDTDCIVTMDRMEFFPAKYKVMRDDEGKMIHLPVVDNFNISAKYIDFLGEVSKIIGKDHDTVTVRNMGKIRDSYNWVPEELRDIKYRKQAIHS